MKNIIKTIKKVKDNGLKTSVPTLEHLLEQRDFVGASILSNFSITDEVEQLLWKGYCAFHNKDFSNAQEIYIAILSGEYRNVPEETTLYLACVYLNMQMYIEAAEAATDSTECSLKYRIMYHLSHKLKYSPESIAAYKEKLSDKVEDELCKAAVMYEQCKYQQVCELYKRMFAEDKSRVGLNLYIAMCYFKMDYYDISMETLLVYQQAHSDSIVAKNLRACNLFRLYNGNAALDEIKGMEDIEMLVKDNDILRHNMVVFTYGQKALQVLPTLISIIPEAKLNLAIYFLHNDEYSKASELLDNLEPKTPQEYILKAITLVTSEEFDIEEAKTLFQNVGSSPSETDTIPGRQCMAQFYFLDQQFEEVNVYLSSIQNYMSEDDVFSWNYGQSLVATKDYETAENVLLGVQNQGYHEDMCYTANLCRAMIYNGNAHKAWNTLDQNSCHLENEIEVLLQIIANDCFINGEYIVAAMAFDALHEFDSDTYTEALISASIGAFRNVYTKTQSKDIDLHRAEREHTEVIINILSKYETNKEVEYVISVLKRWKSEDEKK